MTLAPNRDRDAIEVADLSVALCTRNGTRFVEEQVRSILTQSIVPREIVVGDDASTDDTIAVIEATVASVRAEKPMVTTELRVLRHSSPLGVTRNFEVTITACTSSIVALCDQDDVWLPGRIERLLPVFGDSSVALVHTDAWLVDAEGRDAGSGLLAALEASVHERSALMSGDAFGVLLRRNLVTGATVLLRRSAAEEAMPFPASWLHDEWLAAVAAANGALRLVDEPWLHYRQHDGNAVGASAPDWSRRWAKLREPRLPRAARLVARSAELVAYLERTGRSDAVLEVARAKLAHERWRATLPRWRALRVPRIIAGAIAGRYARFNRGAIDVLRDLVQPV